MIKIGDRVQSHNNAAVVTDPMGRCRHCNNLSRPAAQQKSTFVGEPFVYKDLLERRLQPPCKWCHLLATCVQKLEPKAAEMAERGEAGHAASLFFFDGRVCCCLTSELA